MALSVMKKKDDDTLLRGGRPILDMKTKDTIGTEYDLPSAQFGAKVRVYRNTPKEHHLIVPKKGTKIMSKQEVENYVKSSAYSEDSSIPELKRKENISNAKQEDIKKINK